MPLARVARALAVIGVGTGMEVRLKDVGAFVLIGATGDLAKRMIWPSLYSLHLDGLLAPRLRIVGAVRQPQELTRERMVDRLAQFVAADRFDPEAASSFVDRCKSVAFDANDASSFTQLRDELGDDAQGAVYFIATAPDLFAAVCRGLGECGLAARARGVIIEKPIGKDLASSQEINRVIATAFDEAQVFRIDHYLGKETVQNLLALRFGNVLFEPLWERSWIEHVQITIAETVGVEGRWGYYNRAGALRDMVQNHLLQLLCLVAMEAPSDFDPDAVRNEKLKVLRSLRPIGGDDAAIKTVRGQYGPGAIAGAPVAGYNDEGGGGKRSGTETFVALKAEVDNWRWEGVPFFLRTGKRMPERRTEIVIQFKRVPHDIFGGASPRRNLLRIRLQPEETVELTVMSKEPGLEGMKLKPVTLNLSLSEAFDTHRRRIAYERLILDALRGISTLFVRRDEVEAAWSWVDRIQHGWASLDEPPRAYAAGTWGPSASVALIERAGQSWAD